MLQREGEIRNPSGCAVTGVIDRSGKKMTGESMIEAIAVMHDRSNGLGGGFAGYGIYPHYKDFYAFHLFYETQKAQEETEAETTGAYVFSSGKNMGIFKGVGYPEDIGRFYRLEEYEGYAWTCHGRYPTNTPGWWGGAHPFGLLDLSVVHNGEISSYDANRRYMEMFGYRCTLQTDTEVITYIVDYLHRRKGLTLQEVSRVIAASFWSTIARKEEPARSQETLLRRMFPSLLVTGPFSIIVGFEGGLLALGDRLKLRSMVCAEKGDKAYISSEESAIRKIEPSLDKIYAPAGGEPVIYELYGRRS